MPTVGWITTEQAREDWADAPRNDATLTRLLTVAHEMCVEYGPRPDPLAPDAIPERWKRAQLLDARDEWASLRRDSDDVIAFDEGNAIRVRPLSARVRALLRPPTATIVVG